MAIVGRGADQYTVRFPDGLRDRIKAAAEANNRSMNAEIVATLEDKYTPIDPQLIHALETAVAQMNQEELQEVLLRLRKMAKDPSLNSPLFK